MKHSGSFSIRPHLDLSGTDPWKTPLHFSLGFHVLVLVASLVMPSMLKSPSHPEFYTVNLVSVADVGGQQGPAKSAPAKRPEPAPPAPAPAPPPAAPPAPPPKAPPVIEPPEPVIKKPVVSTALPVPSPPVAPAEPAEVISLAPVKQKKKIETPKPPVDLEKIKQDIAQQQKRSEQEMQKTREAATRAARDAVAKLRESILAGAKTTAPAATTGTGTTTSKAAESGGHEGPAGPAGPGGPPGPGLDEAMKGYYAAVYQRIMEHWFLPPLQNWEASLEAIIVIKVRNDGTLIKSYFEKKSSNIYFNQIVEKTMHDSVPLPPFPKELQESSLEIGLRFTPTGLF